MEANGRYNNKRFLINLSVVAKASLFELPFDA